MSETKDLFIYNFYDYMSSIYIYSHVKTFLIDTSRQKSEYGFDIVLLIISFIIFILILFKVVIIIFYFLFFRTFTAFIHFIKTLTKVKFKIEYCSSFKNAISLLKKVFKRIFTFNFYLYDNNIIGFIMIFSYFIYFISASLFYFSNLELIDNPEKSEYYMILFYLHFESILLIQILCSSFYACRNMKIAILSGLGIFISLNCILITGYFIKEKIENVNGIFEHNEPQRIMNIIYSVIFLLLNGKCLISIILYQKDGK
jgi:hypothetical protein